MSSGFTGTSRVAWDMLISVPGAFCWVQRISDGKQQVGKGCLEKLIIILRYKSLKKCIRLKYVSLMDLMLIVLDS